MEDWRLVKLESAIKVLISKGIITEKEISDEYNKVLKSRTNFYDKDDIYHR